MFSCKVIADSINIVGNRLTTLEVSFPRIILSEVNTHRIVSKNSASSRAIPVEKTLQRILSDGFVPQYWGKNQRGMQAEEEVSEEQREAATKVWMKARDNAIESAKELVAIGIHKQITNRLLEPFMFHTALLSATTWQNLLSLRDHKDAQPEFRQIARLIRIALDENKPKLLQPGEYHLPYVKEENYEEIISKYGKEALLKVSSGKCCRLSYLTMDGNHSIDADYNLSGGLQESGHYSPLEHPSVALGDNSWSGNFQGFQQYRKTIPGEDIFKQ